MPLGYIAFPGQETGSVNNQWGIIRTKGYETKTNATFLGQVSGDSCHLFHELASSLADGFILTKKDNSMLYI